MSFFSKNKTTALLVGIVLVGVCFRMYNLNWGAPFYFHPDERNIASAVTQLKLPEQMNPHFFAYGSLPIYAIYFTGVLVNTLNSLISNNPTQTLLVSFENAIVIGRIYSAVFSVLVSICLYFLIKGVKNQTAALFGFLLSIASVGFIQYAHFGTFEMWITLFAVLQAYALIKFLQTKQISYYCLSIIVTGILISIKISSAVLLLLPIFAVILNQKYTFDKKTILKKLPKQMVIIGFNSLFLIGGVCIIFLITNPFSYFDFTSFQGSLIYESSVALGSLPVFYTGGFFHTIPIIYQIIFVFPFLLNPFITLLSLVCIPYFFYFAFIKKNPTHGIILLTFFLLFFSQAFLFTKWTRYMIPTLPFMYIMVSIILSDLLAHHLNKHNKVTFFTAVLILISFFYALSFVWTIYVKADTRIASYKFAHKHVPYNARIISEVYDLGIVPFNASYNSIKLYNFYDLETLATGMNNQQLQFELANSDFIVLPSQRIIRNRLKKPAMFPKGYEFYKNLTQGNLNFQKIYETPCDVFCKIIYMGNPIWNVEETANVFDRPVVFIFQKQ